MLPGFAYLKSLWMSLGFLSLFSVSQTPITYGPSLMEMSPTTYIIDVDLHGVVFNTDIAGILRYHNNLKNRWTAYGLFGKMLINGDINKLRSTTKVAEHGFDILIKKYPELNNFRKDFITLANLQKPNIEVVALLKGLKAQGYTLVLASNIGKESYEDLCKKFPDIMGLFDLNFLVDPVAQMYGKPAPEYFVGLKKFIADNGHAGKNIVLIDDSEKNVKEAAHHTISGILFKNAAELEKLLKSKKALAS